jgi:hypothetical protein
VSPAGLARLEAIIDAAGIVADLETAMPSGGRPRQLRVRTLLVGMLAAAADNRPAHLTRVHHALVNLDDGDRRRLGVDIDRRRGAHQLTYRQVEYTFGLLDHVLADATSDGQPGETLRRVVDALIEASIPDRYKQSTTAVAVDWTDLETWACPPLEPGGPSADPDASWGHRRGHAPGAKDELFYGYYPQAVTLAPQDGGPKVPELVRRLLVTSCHVDAPPALVKTLQALHKSGVAIGDVLADSGYAHRLANHWALPLRALGAALVQDHHPHDRGPKGTHNGAIIANGNLYCPCTPTALLTINPLPRAAATETVAAHDTLTAEAARYKLGRITADDPDGYHRVQCPAAAGKLRCPLRPDSLNLGAEHPEIATPPEYPPTCCTQQTITVPPSVNAKTAQKHDYPGADWRNSYARRSGAERTNATIKDPAATNIRRGWCRLMGLTAITMFLTCAVVTRNNRIIDAYENRQTDNERRAANGQPPATRRRRRKTLADLTNTPP